MDCKNKEAGLVEKVIGEVRDTASNFTLRAANYTNALLPISFQEAIYPASSDENETKKLDNLRSSWYSLQDRNQSSRFSTQTEVSSLTAVEPISVWLLGKEYRLDITESECDQLNLLLEDFNSQFWFTYRHHFPAILPSTYTSDSGWGCMMRTGQCILGQTFIRMYLGREWRLKDNEDPKIGSIYIKILEWFLDELHSQSPYSIHRITLLGRQLHIKIGEWFRPSTIANVIKSLVCDHTELALNVYLNQQGVIYKPDILNSTLPTSAYSEMASRSPSSAIVHSKSDSATEFIPTLLLMTIQLGPDDISPEYFDALRELFQHPQFVGIAGGKPKSSYFFMGIEGDDLIYLDPHHNRPAIPTNRDSFTLSDFQSYHCSQLKKLPLSLMDPSMVVGFFCNDAEEFEDLCFRINSSKAKHKIFTVSDQEETREQYNFNMVLNSDDFVELNDFA